MNGTAGWCPIFVYYILQFMAMEAETLICLSFMLYVSGYLKNDVISICTMSLVAVCCFGTAVLTGQTPFATGRDSVAGNICIQPRDKARIISSGTDIEYKKPADGRFFVFRVLYSEAIRSMRRCP